MESACSGASLVAEVRFIEKSDVLSINLTSATREEFENRVRVCLINKSLLISFCGISEYFITL